MIFEGVLPAYKDSSPKKGLIAIEGLSTVGDCDSKLCPAGKIKFDKGDLHMDHLHFKFNL